MSVRRIAALTGVAALVLSMTACSGDDTAIDNTNDELIIGVSPANPGLAQQNTDGSFSGFDVDLAAYVAKGLGWAERDVIYVPVMPADRESSLANGDVDMIVSAYAINAERDKSVDFAGPYFIAGQDLLVTQDSRITGPRSLDGRTVCGTVGSPGLARVQDPEYSAGAILREEPDNQSCVELLLAGEVDAVTTDDVVLAGFAQQHPDEIKVVGSPFSTEYYGIGLPEGSPDVAVVNDLLARAIDDGTWQADFDRHLDRSGYTAPLPPTPGTQVF